MSSVALQLSPAPCPNLLLLSSLPRSSLFDRATTTKLTPSSPPPVSTSGRQRPPRCNAPPLPGREHPRSLARSLGAGGRRRRARPGRGDGQDPSSLRPSASVSPPGEKEERRNGGFVVCLGPVTRRIRSIGCYTLVPRPLQRIIAGRFIIFLGYFNYISSR